MEQWLELIQPFNWEGRSMEEPSMSEQALRSTYDVIVIGAGLGGLTT